MKADLFQFQEYRAYLRQEFSAKGLNRGRRAKLADFLNCQTSYISQVLTDRTHLNLEQGYRTSQFLQHSPEERRYFLLLIQESRAATPELRRHFSEDLFSIHKARNDIRTRIAVKTELSVEDQMKYYSAWYYSAIHVLTAFEDFGTAEALSVRLKLEIQVVKQALRFLVDRGFVIRGAKGYSIGKTRIHLSTGSEMLPRHHTNWRMRAIDSVDHETPHDLHYTAVLGISRRDVKVLREKILTLLQQFEPIIQSSKIEAPVAMAIDLFRI